MNRLPSCAQPYRLQKYSIRIVLELGEMFDRSNHYLVKCGHLTVIEAITIYSNH